MFVYLWREKVVNKNSNVILIYTQAHTYTHIYVCVCAEYTLMCICMHADISTCVCVCVCVCESKWVNTYVCIALIFFQWIGKSSLRDLTKNHSVIHSMCRVKKKKEVKEKNIILSLSPTPTSNLISFFPSCIYFLFLFSVSFFFLKIF